MNKKQMAALRKIIKSTPVKLKPFRFEVTGDGISIKTVELRDVNETNACGRMHTICSRVGVAWSLHP